MAEKQESKKEVFKIEKCKVLWVKPYSFAVDFKGYGVEIPKESDFEINDEFVNIKYISDIGKPDFEFELVV